MRTTLDRETVIAAASRVLAGSGFEGLTLRNVAAELGVQPGALYWHFANKQELLDQMATAITVTPLADLSTPKPGQDWADWLGERARALRHALLATRDGARLVAASRPTTDRRPEAEAMVATLVASGFEPADALRALSALKHYIIGAVLEEQDLVAGRTVWPQESDPDRYAQFPHLEQAVVTRTDESLDAQFEYGLRALLAGLAGT